MSTTQKRELASPRHLEKAVATRRSEPDVQPARSAFALALRLAKHVDLLVTAPIEMVQGHGDYFDHLSTIRTELRRGYRARGAAIRPDELTIAAFAPHLHSDAARDDFEAQLDADFNTREEAGYLYGLAIGLAVAAGPLSGGGR